MDGVQFDDDDEYGPSRIEGVEQSENMGKTWVGSGFEKGIIVGRTEELVMEKINEISNRFNARCITSFLKKNDRLNVNGKGADERNSDTKFQSTEKRSMDSTGDFIEGPSSKRCAPNASRVQVIIHDPKELRKARAAWEAAEAMKPEARIDVDMEYVDGNLVKRKVPRQYGGSHRGVFSMGMALRNAFLGEDNDVYGSWEP